MADELGQSEHDKRHGEQDEPDGHDRPGYLARDDHETNDQLGQAGQPNKEGVANAERVKDVQERALGEERLGKRWIQQLLRERAVGDAEAHRDPEQVECGRRRVLVFERAMYTTPRVERYAAGPGDE